MPNPKTAKERKVIAAETGAPRQLVQLAGIAAAEDHVARTRRRDFGFGASGISGRGGTLIDVIRLLAPWPSPD